MAYPTFPTVYTEVYFSELTAGSPYYGTQILPDVSSGGFTRKFNNIVNTFGDGFVQVVPRGINIEMDEWDLKFVLPQPVAAAVASFLTDRQAAEPFYWTPQNHPQDLFRCGLDFKRGDLKGDSETITCKFIRWYGAAA